MIAPLCNMTDALSDRKQPMQLDANGKIKPNGYGWIRKTKLGSKTKPNRHDLEIKTKPKTLNCF